jgi:hypothetical protein
MEMMYAQAFNILPGLEKLILIPGMFLNLILEQIENKARANTIHRQCTASVFPSRRRSIGHRLRSIFCGVLHRLAETAPRLLFATDALECLV